MNDQDLETRLHDYYTEFTPRDSSRAVSGVGRVVTDARSRSRVPGGWLGEKWLRGVAATAAALAVVVAIAVALVPLWHGPAAVPGASPTSSANVIPTIEPPVGGSPVPVAQGVSQSGVGPGGRIWAVFGNSLEVSLDHGRTWRASALPAQSAAWWLAGVAVIDADHIWIAMSTTMTHATNTTAATSVTTVAIYVTVDGGDVWRTAVARSFDGKNVMASLTAVDSKVGFAVFTPVSEEGVSQPSTIIHTLDGGGIWLVTNTKARIMQPVSASDWNTLWSGFDDRMGVGPLLQVSHDSGATWSPVQLPGVGATTTDNLTMVGSLYGVVSFVSSSEGYAEVLLVGTAAESRYYRTIDGGRTWSLVATRMQMPGGAVFVDADHWYEPNVAAGVSESTADGGQTWTKSPQLDPTGPVTSFGMIDAKNGIGWGSTGFPGPDGKDEQPLYLTWDGASTWHAAVFVP